MNTVYYHLGNAVTSSALPDYLGEGSLASLARWQSAAKNTTGVEGMVGRIWADIAAAAVVGTKGVHDLGGVRVAVRPVVRRIKYHLPFAVPVIVLLVGCVGVLVATVVMSVLRRSSIEKVRANLRRTAVGRALVLLLEDKGVGEERIKAGLALGEKEWSVGKGGMEVDLSMGTSMAEERAEERVPTTGVEKGSEGTSENNKPPTAVTVTSQAHGGADSVPVSPVSGDDERRSADGGRSTQRG